MPTQPSAQPSAQPSDAGGESSEPCVSCNCTKKTGSGTNAKRPCSLGPMTRKQVLTHFPEVIYGTSLIFCLVIARTPWPSCATPPPIAPGLPVLFGPRLHSTRILRFRAGSAIADVALRVFHLPNVPFQDRGMDRPFKNSHARSPFHLGFSGIRRQAGRTSSAQDSLGRHQPLAQRDRAHSGASSHLLAEGLLELQEASRLETRVPGTGDSGGYALQAPVAHAVCQMADPRGPASSTSAPVPGPSPRSPAGICTRFDQQGTQITIYNFFPHTCFFQAA